MRKFYSTKKLKKAFRLLCHEKFSRVTKKQIRDINKDYREYLYYFLKLHLTNDNFNLLLNTKVYKLYKWGYESKTYYQNELEELKLASKFLHPIYRLRFFLGEDTSLSPLNMGEELDASSIYYYAEGWGMEVLRKFFYDYVTVNPDPVDAAWEDTRFDDYLEEYSKNNPEKLKNNPWDYPELQKHFWHWRDRLSWYRQKQKSAVVEVLEKPLPDRDTEIYQIIMGDNNTPSFVDSEKILFSNSIEDFHNRWFKLELSERKKEGFLKSKNGEGDMIKKGTSHIFADKTFTVNDAWVSAIDWFGSHRKYHINKWEIRVKWISFQDKYYRIVSHKANGICKLELFPKLMVAVEECNGNYLLECEAKFCPKYSMAIPKNKWQKTTFEDFNDNYINSICYITDGILEDEETLQKDIKELTITQEFMRDLLVEV